jgi:hypothetical protein
MHCYAQKSQISFCHTYFAQYGQCEVRHHARLELFKKLGMIWKGRSLSTKGRRESAGKSERKSTKTFHRKSADFHTSIPHSSFRRSRANKIFEVSHQ